MKEKLSNRYFILSIGFLIFGLMIIYRLFNLQIVEGEKYYASSQKRYLKQSDIEAPRGKILDTNGVPIAVNRQGYAAHLVKTSISTSELNEMLLKLMDIFEKNNENHVDSLSKYLTFSPTTFNGRSDKEIVRWQIDKNRLGMKEENVKATAPELFKYLRESLFQIDEKYTDEQAYRIMILRYEILINNWNFTTGGTISLAKDLDLGTICEIEERNNEFPGLFTTLEPVREYIDAYPEAHILGYIRSISQGQYDNLKDEGYDNNDLIGKTGIELTAERYLRGVNGKMSIEVDSNGLLTRKHETVAAIPGSDVILTLDRNLQKVSIESLAKHIDIIKNKKEDSNYADANAGAVAVMDVNSGAVLALASYPSFDPQVYLQGSEDKEAQRIISSLDNDENRAQLNRAIQGLYEPGSTFKPLVAIAGLEKGIITPYNSNIYDPGQIEIGNRKLFCLERPRSGHGMLNLKRALETSCNVYFYLLGVDTGIDTLNVWADHFGLGKQTGIDLPSEKPGFMSSMALKKELRNDVWRPADTAQVSIGQYDSRFTPLQMANYMSTIANGGKRYEPYIIKEIIRYDGSQVNVTEPTYTQVPVQQSTIDAVKQGMVAVTSSIDGTAYKSFQGLPFEVAGKTGTAQTSKGIERSPNALFLCYAPADDPQIAIAVVVEKGAWGSNVAPIARDIIDEYFGLKKANAGSSELKTELPVLNQ
ncbi:MAG: penicillin-binding protein 2 [Clostridiaceae bacterium]|nr:penicillin-binding protein 2 [Clostridiaceae bacterium]